MTYETKADALDAVFETASPGLDTLRADVARLTNMVTDLTFEIVADVDSVTIGDVIARVAETAGRRSLPVAGSFPPVAGYIVGRAGSLGDALSPLLTVADAAIVDNDGLRIEGPGRESVPIVVDAIDARLFDAPRPPERLRRAAADSQPAALELAFYDTSRDYQPGLQRARRGESPSVEHQSIAAAMEPAQAKALATELLNTAHAARLQRRIRLSWRHHAIGPGAMVTLPESSVVWRVREARFENFIVHLDLERRATALMLPRAMVMREVDGGRSMQSAAEIVGPTTLLVLDLPPLPGELPAVPRLWIAGNGAGAGWRRASVAISTDSGESFASVGSLEGGTVIGTALTALPIADSAGWDRHSSVEVELLADRDWLEPRSPAAVLAGANLALLGNELIQFSGADAIGPRRFRLHGLLRGRRGTEAAVMNHVAAERFVLIDVARMLPVELPLEMLGRAGVARAFGSGDGAGIDVPFRIDGAALRPMSPAHLRARWVSDDLSIEWVRRSRGGFGWTDFVDAPLAESIEKYQVDIIVDGQTVRQCFVPSPQYTYCASDRVADGGGTVLTINVAQWSADVGPGDAASIKVAF